MNTFFNDYITIIRNKDGEYVKEEITTAPVLSGGNISPEENRARVIERLRADDSVFLVLEDNGGICREEAAHQSGFCFNVLITDGDKPQGELRVTYKDAVAYTQEFTPTEGESGMDMVDNLVNTVMELLDYIRQEDFSFVDDDCPYFSPVEEEEPLDLYNAGTQLGEEGFQTERLSTINYLPGPYLFVHENEVILLGSRRFSGDSLFLEMKRIFNGIDPEVVTEKIRKVKKGFYGIDVIHWEDGSWSFRINMDADTYKSNFKDKLLSDLARLRRMISSLEDQDGIGCEPWPIMTEQRHLFIYETLDCALKLNKINV